MDTWDGTALEGIWTVTYKLDGVRAIIKDGIALSRSGKPLHNLQNIPDGEYEIFDTNWETSVSLVRTKEGTPVEKRQAYSLKPLDPRLILGTFHGLSKEGINDKFKQALKLGHEGLVLHGKDGTQLKVKPKATYDTKVTGVQPGKGKHEGRLGAILTEMGKVGTGFTDEQREQLKTIEPGTVIEVEAMGLTKNNKFRHPRFVRVRFDK